MDPQVNPFGNQPNNPAPAPDNNQPVAPASSAAPIAPTMAPVGPNAPKKKSKLGLILGLSIGGGVLLIGVLITVLILVVGGGVSRQDYINAQKAADDLRTPYNKIASIYISTSSTETQVKNTMDTLKTNRATFDADFKALGDMKAIKNDPKAQDLYKKAADEKVKLDTYLDAIQEAYEVIYPISEGMDDASYGNSADAIAALKSYQTQLQGLKVTQPVNKDYIDQINKILPDFISALEAYANMDYSNYDPSLSRNVTTQTTNLTNADSDWRSNLEKLNDDANFSSAFNNLGEYLTDQLNKN